MTRLEIKTHQHIRLEGKTLTRLQSSKDTLMNMPLHISKQMT